MLASSLVPRLPSLVLAALVTRSVPWVLQWDVGMACWPCFEVKVMLDGNGCMNVNMDEDMIIKILRFQHTTQSFLHCNMLSIDGVLFLLPLFHCLQSQELLYISGPRR
jgi:hypothetical protein